MVTIKIVIKIFTILLCCIYGILNIIRFHKGVKSYNDLQNFGIKIEPPTIVDLDYEEVEMMMESFNQFKKQAVAKFSKQFKREIITNGVELILKVILIVLCINYL